MNKNESPSIMSAMNSFIDDYLTDPSGAISAARELAHSKTWYDEFDESHIYEEVASPEFHLYVTILPLQSR